MTHFSSKAPKKEPYLTEEIDLFMNLSQLSAETINQLQEEEN